LALYDTDTRNYFRVNDRQCPDRTFTYRLTKQGTESADGMPVIVSPTPVGFLLIRILITDPSRVEYLREIQRSFKVEVVE